jgi:NAD(P)H-flavin reductase
VFRTSDNTPVFVATGTGIAPFVAYQRSGVSGFILLHGVSNEQQMIYRTRLEVHSRRYVPCLGRASRNKTDGSGPFIGRVTDYVNHVLPPGEYDFYLCGRREMIYDVLTVIDDKFTTSRVYTERYT